MDAHRRAVRQVGTEPTSPVLPPQQRPSLAAVEARRMAQLEDAITKQQQEIRQLKAEAAVAASRPHPAPTVQFVPSVMPPWMAPAADTSGYASPQQQAPFQPLNTTSGGWGSMQQNYNGPTPTSGQQSSGATYWGSRGASNTGRRGGRGRSIGPAEIHPTGRGAVRFDRVNRK